MATFVPDKGPLVFNPGGTDGAAAYANAGGNYLQSGINTVDVFPVHLEAGAHYKLFTTGKLGVEVWDDYARQVVAIYDNGQTGAYIGDARELTSFSVETTGLHYLKVTPGSRMLLDWALGPGPNYSVYAVSVYRYDFDLGPNRTPSTLSDWIDGTGAGETIVSWAGNDTVFGWDGDDTVRGHAGDDDLNGSLGNDIVYGDPGRDFVRGGQGDDWVLGGDGDDWHVNGNIGNDLVYGDAGNDALFGGPGFDRLYGGIGNDTLSGDLGNDSLYGEAGADRYDFGQDSGQDTVFGFDGGGGDRIRIAVTGIETFDDLVGRLAEEAGGVRLDLGGGNTVLFAGQPRDAIWSGVVEFG